MKKQLLSLAAISALTASVSLNASEEEKTATVVVTATKSEQKLSDVTANTTVITSEMIEKRHYRDLTDLLNDVSGISFSRNGGLGRNVDLFLRGMSTNRTLVLIDGIRFQDPSSIAGADFANLMLCDVERVEIIKGAQSGVWGADAAAGVINIITKKASKGFGGAANVEYGSFETKKYGANAGYKDERFDLKIGASKTETEGFSALAPKGEDVSKYEDDGYKNTTLNLNGGINLGSGRIEGAYASINALGEYDASSPDDKTMKSDVKERLYKAAYIHTIGANRIKLSNKVSTFKRDEIGSTFGVKLFSGDTHISELSDEIEYTDDASLMIGFSSERYSAEYTGVSGGKNSKTSKNTAFFATNTNRFGDVSISESLRHDDYDSFDTVTTGKVGVKYTPDKWLFGANYGTAYNAPNLIQVLNPWGAANENLEPETVKSYDASIGYDFITLTYFWQKVENLIFWNDNGTEVDWSDFSTYGNMYDDFYDNGNGTSTIKGYEIELKKPVAAISSSFSVNYTFLDAKNGDNQTLLYRPKEQLDANFDCYAIDSLHIGLNAQYVGERYEKDDEQGAQTGKYTLYSAVLNYSADKNKDIYAKIENLTDLEYQIANGYATAGRSLYVGVNINF